MKIKYSTDILVIGGGIVGQAIASVIKDSGKMSMIVDAGPGFSNKSKTRVGKKSLGVDKPAKYRVFGLGGTSKTWGGNLIPFTNRELSRFLGADALEEVQSEIVPALKFLGFENDSEAVAREWQSGYLQSEGKIISIQKFFRRKGGALFIYPETMTPSPSQKFVEGLWCSSIHQTKDGYGSTFISRTGSTVEIESKEVVLANGGIESLRLLKSSENLPIDQSRIGNYFSTHLTGIVGIASFEKSCSLVTSSGRFTVAQDFHHLPAADESGISAWKITYLPVRKALLEIPSLGLDVFPLLFRSLSDIVLGRSTYLINVDGDQYPNPASRVTLNNCNEMIIETAVCSKDMDSIANMKAILGNYLKETAHVRFFSKSILRFLGKSHHLGGFPIENELTKGYVTEELEIKGLPGLFVCSSSTFPVFSSANPTLLLVQLALRLGRKLK